MARFLLLLGFILTVICTRAQIYPVQSTTVLTPPYSTYLPDYAGEGTPRLKCILTLRDLTEPQYQVSLQLSIALNGKVIMRTSPQFRPPPLTVLPGVPVVISGADLTPYLNSENLDFSGYSRNQYEQTKSLPEGSYTISFTAYAYARPDQQLSNEGAASFYLAKAEPPLINYPACGQRIGTLPYWGVDLLPQATGAAPTSASLLFQWLPRNTASLNSAGQTEYQLELWEVKPKGSNPNAVVQSSLPVFTATTDNSMYVYQPADPLLNADLYGDGTGGVYAWRVTARDKTGRDLFANGGKSQVCYFTYGGPAANTLNLAALQNVQVAGETHNRGRIGWTKNAAYDNYTVYYRKAGSGKDGFEWFSSETPADSLKIYDLAPLNEYEVRVQGRKGTDYGPFSEIKTFRTKEKPVVACGQEVSATGAQPLGAPYTGLTENSIVTLGNSEIQILKITANPQPGWYSGEGSASFLGVLLKVAFDHIYVNTDRIVTRGEAHAVQGAIDPLEEQKARAKGTASLQKWKGKVPNPETATLPELKEFVSDLLSVPDAVINGTLVLSVSEKQTIAEAKTQMVEAMETLNKSSATPEEKKAAEAKLRNALKSSKAALDKLMAGVGSGVATVISNLLKGIREFLKGYKGTEEDKKQAIVYASQTDSLVQVYLQRTDLPDSLKNGLRTAYLAARPAWEALGRATPCDATSGTQGHGPNGDEYLIAGYECHTVLANAEQDWIEKVEMWEKEIQMVSDGNYISIDYSDIREKIIAKAKNDKLNFVTPNGKIISLPTKRIAVNFIGNTIDRNAVASKPGSYVKVYSEEEQDSIWIQELPEVIVMPYYGNGILHGFIVDGKKYEAVYKKKDGKIVFAGYYEIGTNNPYSGTLASCNSSTTVICGISNNPCDIQVVSGTMTCGGAWNRALTSSKRVVSLNNQEDIGKFVRNELCDFESIYTLNDFTKECKDVTEEELEKISTQIAGLDDINFDALKTTAKVSLIKLLLCKSSLSDENLNAVTRILSTSKGNEQVELSKLFSENKYERLYKIYGSYEKYFSGVHFEYYGAFINTLSVLIEQNFSKLNVPITTETETSFSTITGITSVQIPVGQKYVYYLGLDNNAAYRGGGKEISLGSYGSTGTVKLSGDKRISLEEDYWVDPLKTHIICQGCTPPVDKYKVSIDHNVDPFEPIQISFVKNYQEEGFTAFENYTMPAIWVLWAQKAVNKAEFHQKIRTAGNAIQIGAAVFTAGESLTVTTFISRLAAAAAAMDEVVQNERQKLTPQEYDQVKQYYEAWNNVYVATTLADGAVGLYQIGKNWEVFYNIAKKAGGSLKTGLKTAFTTLGDFAKWKSITKEGDELVNAIKTSVKSRIGSTSGFTLKYTDAEIATIVNKGKQLGLTDDVVEDMVYIGCRDAKPLTSSQVMQQFEDALIVSQRGYPYRFSNIGEFTSFKNELRQGLDNIGMPTSDVRLQGSAVRSSTAQDLDLSVTLSKTEMDIAIKKAYSNSIKKNGQVVDISNYNESQLRTLQEEIDIADRSLFNAKARDFADNFKNRRLWPDAHPGLKPLVTDLQKIYGDLNITIQEATSNKNLKPFIKL